MNAIWKQYIEDIAIRKISQKENTFNLHFIINIQAAVADEQLESSFWGELGTGKTAQILNYTP